MLKILLDAGHYGYYNQSPVYPEYYESKQMWKLHLLLKKHLEDNYDVKVGVTRTNQAKDLAVFSRGALAKGYDLFLSLHSNASSSSKTDRVDVYFSYDNRNGSKTFAELLVKAIADCMEVAEGSAKTRKSEKGNWEYYGVLRGAASVGCPLYYIIEHSFHTNEYAAKWLMSEGNLDNLAKVEAETVAKYFGLKKKETNTIKEASTVNIELTVLRKGSEGEEVKTLQTLLNAKGYKGKDGKVLSVDGDFGSNTDYAVRAFQKAKGLSVDGICGANTWNKLLKG